MSTGSRSLEGGYSSPFRQQSPDAVLPVARKDSHNGKGRFHLLNIFSRVFKRKNPTELAKPPEPQRPPTTQELIAMIKKGIDPSKANPSDVLTQEDQTTEQQVTVEERTKQNRRMASALNTLLVSFPPGEQRDEVREKFPDLDDMLMFNVDDEMETWQNKELGAAEIQDDLDGKLAKAIDLVQGPERAMFFLQYPGVTGDEALEDVGAAPSVWVETSLNANTLLPQANLGILCRLGQQIATDIAGGKMTWDDVVHAYLDRDQIETEKALVARLHKAYRQSPVMPEGHAHPNAHRVIPDFYFQYLWRAELHAVLNTSLVMAQWAEDTRALGILPPEVPIETLREGEDFQVILAQSNIERLTAFYSSPQAKPYVDVLLQLYAAGNRVLGSLDGVALQRQHRDEYSDRKPHPPFPSNASEDLTTLFSQEIGDELVRLKDLYKSLKFPSNLAEVFMDCLWLEEEGRSDRLVYENNEDNSQP